MKKLGTKSDPEPKSLTRSSWFWILQVLILISCTLLSLHFYPKAFPMVDLEIKMDRVGALNAAQKLTETHTWGPKNYRQAASFESDDQTQTFVELSAGGSAAFKKIIEADLYSPYTWRVRQFAEGNPNETQIRFNPRGDFYGFTERLPEDAPGKALSAESAREIAEKRAILDWKVPLKDYVLVEKSAETTPSHRIDHSFVYERPNIQPGEGKYRLKLVVSGDLLTEILYFVKIPDAFSRKYGEMRSFNNTISEIASVAMIILYLLGGCGLGLFFLGRRHYVIWKTPVICAGLVAGLQLLEQFNHLPLIWMGYDTALSAHGFLIRNAIGAIVNSLTDFVLLAISFMAAESLSRKAFPKHPQLWRVWSPENSNSLAILGRTVGGYLSVGFFFCFVVFMYIFGTQVLGWWNPSDTLFHPDGLATYFPWLTSVANSLHAGFWEESLFRAVPLASAALLGNRFGHRKGWIFVAFIVQAFIFASAHANYPTQPSYARVIELIFPSFMFGGLYLVFGLLPGIILHYTFDVISFSIPLFATSSPHVWIDRSLVILISLIPLGIILVSRIRSGKWTELKAKELNQSWHPPIKVSLSLKPIKFVQSTPLKPAFIHSFIGLSALAFVLWIALNQFKESTFPLEINREQAILLAEEALNKKGLHLSFASQTSLPDPSSWQALASATEGFDSSHHFIWKTEGPIHYKELNGSYLMPPAWLVRFVRFGVDIEARAEEYQVYVTRKGDIYRIRHELPESQDGATLDEAQARQIARRWIETTYSQPLDSYKEVTHRASKLPNRRDWLFVFLDQSVHLKSGEARIGIHIAGNEAVSSRRFIFIPEEWERSESNRENQLSIIKMISITLLMGLLGVGIILALVSWTQKRFSPALFRSVWAVLLGAGFLSLINDIPGKFAQFSTVEPRINQAITLFAFGTVKVLFISTCFALVIGYLFRPNEKPSSIQTGNQPKKNLKLIFGYCIGVFGTLLTAGSQNLLPPPAPAIGKVSPLNSFLPIFYGISEIETLAFVTLMLALTSLGFEKITAGRTKKIAIGSLGIALFSFALTGIGIQDWSNWLLQGAVLSLYLIFTYLYLIREQIELIPLAVAAGLTLFEVKQLLMHPYPGAPMDALFAIACLGAASFAWYRLVSSDSKSR